MAKKSDGAKRQSVKSRSGGRAPSVAVYPGSFDPPTLGHLDVIERAARIFGHVIVAVGVNSSKSSSGLFSATERMEFLTHMTRGLENVEVAAFSGLVVEFAKARGATALVRGLRTDVDFTYEMQMALMNRTLAAGIETVFIPTGQEFGHVSATLVKEVAALGGDVASMTAPSVTRALAEKFSAIARR